LSSQADNSFGFSFIVNSHLYQASFSLIRRLSNGISHFQSIISCLFPVLSPRNTFLIEFQRREKVFNKSIQLDVSTLETTSDVSQVIFLIVDKVASLYSGIKNRNVFGSVFITVILISGFFALALGRYVENQVASLSRRCGG